MKPENLRGTALGSEDFAKGRVLTTTGAPNARYAWDTGQAIGRYLEGLKEGKLLGVRCRACDRTVIPPRAFCEICFRPIDGTVELRSTGTVNTFSLCYVTWDMRPLRRPMIPAVIEIDGADPMKGILHLLGEVAPEDVKVGLKVEAVWKAPEKRKGEITDILYFRPTSARLRAGAKAGPKRKPAPKKAAGKARAAKRRKR